jgi:hypothetical protein
MHSQLNVQYKMRLDIYMIAKNTQKANYAPPLLAPVLIVHQKFDEALTFFAGL